MQHRQANLILLGDFDDRIGTDHHTWEGVIGSEGIGKCNSKGLLLLRKIAEHDLLITNTVFRLSNRNKTSCMYPRSKHWHLIDYVIVSHQDDTSSESKKAAYNNICKTAQSRVRDMQDSWLSKKAEEIQSFADRKDMKNHDALKTVKWSRELWNHTISQCR